MAVYVVYVLAWRDVHMDIKDLMREIPQVMLDVPMLGSCIPTTRSLGMHEQFVFDHYCNCNECLKCVLMHPEDLI